MPSVQRKVSRSRSIVTIREEEKSEAGDQVMKTRKVSMEMFDIPNIRGLSLSSYNINI